MPPMGGIIQTPSQMSRKNNDLLRNHKNGIKNRPRSSRTCANMIGDVSGCLTNAEEQAGFWERHPGHAAEVQSGKLGHPMLLHGKTISGYDRQLHQAVVKSIAIGPDYHADALCNWIEKESQRPLRQALPAADACPRRLSICVNLKVIVKYQNK